MTMTTNSTRNGVDTATLFATLDAVKANPEIAKFQFRATNSWVSGTHSRSTIHGFYGAMQEMTHVESRTYEADHPAVRELAAGRQAGEVPGIGPALPPGPHKAAAHCSRPVPIRRRRRLALTSR